MHICYEWLDEWIVGEWIHTAESRDSVEKGFSDPLKQHPHLGK